MGYYIAKGYFDTVPKSLDEAAMIDGANKNTVFFKIILPLSKPIVVYTFLMAFVGPWGDYMQASYLAQGNPNMFNVAVGLQQMISGKNYILCRWCFDINSYFSLILLATEILCRRCNWWSSQRIKYEKTNILTII